MDSINGISYYLNTSEMTIFFFQEDSAKVHCACNTVQFNEKCDFRVFPFRQVVQKHNSYLRWHSKASFVCLLYP